LIDQQCAEGHCCEVGGCVARECCDNSDCGDGQLCDAGSCAAGCSAGTCPDGYQCQDGRCAGACTSGCSWVEDCWWEQTVIEECGGPIPGDTCLHGHQEQCDVSECDPDTCTPIAGGACRCGSSDDCPSGYSCAGGYCSLDAFCAADLECPQGAVCRGGRCAQSCSLSGCDSYWNPHDYEVCESSCLNQTLPSGCDASGGSCTAGCGESCSGETVNCSCVQDSDCQAGHTCLEGLCLLGEVTSFARCGDSVTQFPEQCDDGGSVGGDGCSANCLSDETCGNGVLDMLAGEECDDGNSFSDDGCTATCEAEGCGDGILQSDEACDDGNLIDGDGCSADCLSDETCGNGVTDTAAGEECDSGAQAGSYGCAADCTVSGEYAKATGLWQLNPVWGYWGGAHIVVLEGDTVLFSKRRGTNGGTTPGAPQCDRRYSVESSGLSYLDGDCGPLELLFSSSTTGRLGSFRLRQIVSCPGKSLEQIEAGECVPVPSPSGAFVDGVPVW
jgi:cysteine-rich repeat protein